MSTLFFISRRFSNRKGRGALLSTASIVSISSVAIGTLAVIVSMSILAGFEETFRSATMQIDAHITVRPHHGELVSNGQSWMEKIQAIDGVQNVHPAIHVDALIEKGDATQGVRIVGVDSVRYARDIAKSTLEQHPVLPPYTLSIGRPLAVESNISVSDNVIVLAMDGESMPIIDQCTITDVYSTGFSTKDKLQAYANIEYLRTLAGIDEHHVHSFSVYATESANIDSLAWSIQRELGYPWLAMTAIEENAAVFAWIDLQKEPIPIVLGLLCLVAAGTVAASMFILVLEKISAIGILRSMGLSKRNVRWLFLVQGLSFGVIGNSIGVALALGFSLLQQHYQLISLDATVYYLESLPVSINGLHYVVAVSASLLVCGLMSLLPAFAGAKIPIVESIRFK